MKIGIVLSSTPGYSETFFTSKISGLQAQGFEVVLFTQVKRSDFNVCPVIKSPKIYKNPVKQVILMIFVFMSLMPHLKSILKYIKLEKIKGVGTFKLLKKVYLNSHILSKKVDWLHFGFATQAIDNEHLAKAIGAKMAISFRGFDINVYPIKYPGCYNLVWSNVDKVHTISEYLIDKAYCLGLSKKIDFKVIPPAIDYSNFKTIKTKVSSNTLQIVTVARLNWIKGLDFAIDAMQILKNKGLEFEYHIVGSGTPTEIERYAFQIHQLGLEKQVFLYGKQSHSDTMLKLNSADIYLQPSIQEGFCNSVLEAQARGIMTLVSDVGGLKENVIHEVTGWRIPERDVNSIVNGILQIVNVSTDTKNKVSENAIARVKSSFNLKDQQKQFVSFYLNEK